MKKILVLALLSLFAASVSAQAAVTAGVSVTPAATSFFVSISGYFAVAPKDVVAVRQQGIPDEEVPVVFFLSRQAKVAPSIIMELRLKSQLWREIAMRYGYGPEIFYVPVEPGAVVGPPYGHAYGYYRNKPRSEWDWMRLDDAEVINLVNLKFLSEHFNYQPEDIMKMRRDGRKFYAINDTIYRQRQAEKNPPHKTGTKKQIGKMKKFIKKI